MKKQTNIVATPAQLSAAFTEWMRRWHESPEATRAAAESMLTAKPRTYGAEVTPYFISLLDELAAAQERA
jgi:hypothetical protein